MYCSLSLNINMSETLMARKDRLFPRVVSKNSNNPKWRFIADDAITLGGIGVTGSPLCICGGYKFVGTL